MTKAPFCIILWSVFNFAASLDCGEFAYTKMRVCYRRLLIGSNDEVCIKKHDTLEVIMSSKSKRYVTHQCQYSKTKPDMFAVQCGTKLSAIASLEFVECSLVGFDVNQYAGPMKVEKIIINDKLFREVNIYFDTKSIKNITYLYATSRKQFQAKFSKTMRNLEAFHLYRFNLPSFISHPFGNLSNLQTLHLTYGTLDSVDEDFFYGLFKLKTLDLTGNKISAVAPSAFSYTSQLVNLHIGNNKIKSLPSNLFKNVLSLKTFDVRNNPGVDRVPDNYFKYAKHLETFLASNCSLKFIEVSSFSGAQRLKALNLSHNELITIEAGSFANLRELLKFDISYNPITIFHPIDPFGPSANLQQIIANNCNLTKMPIVDFQKHNLTKLDLSFNQITYVRLQIASKRKTEVLLNDNNIAVIGISSSKTGSNSLTYTLANNYPRCTCHSKSFLDFLASDQNKNIISDANSVYCRGSNNVKVTDVSLKSLICPSYCPLDCYCVENTIECRALKLLTPPFPLPLLTNILHLENNCIDSLASPYPYYWDNISHVYLSNNCLKSMRDWKVPSSLIGISLDGNSLQDLPLSLMKMVEETPGFEISLADNDWNCDCDFIKMKDWFDRNKDKIRDAGVSFCQLHASRRELIKDIPADCFCGSVTIINDILISIIIIVILLVLAEVAFYYKTNTVIWFRKRSLLPSMSPSKSAEGRIHPIATDS